MYVLTVMRTPFILPLNIPTDTSQYIYVQTLLNILCPEDVFYKRTI